MDRVINYNGAVPLETDLLNTNKNTMIAIGMALQAIVGTATLIDGLACTPTGPASLQVALGAGSIYTFGNVDGSAFSSLGSDTTHQVVKQGIRLAAGNVSCPAPATTGQSIYYIIQAEYQDIDGGATVLPYYNAANPAVAFNGPANAGTSNNTVRQGACVVNVKAGTPATTGSETVPTPDAGFTALWKVHVTNGQTTITSGNITPYSGVTAATGSSAFWSTPFLTEKLSDKVSIATGDLRWAPLAGGGGGRTILTNATTLHVGPTGNDSTGNGSSGSPWLTLQHAINTLVSSYDLAGFTATIQLADGTYAPAAATLPFTGGAVVINGNSGTPSNVVISSTSSTSALLASGSGVNFTVQNLKIQNTSSGIGLDARDLAGIVCGAGLIFGAAGNIQVNAQDNAKIFLNANYTISAGAALHLSAGPNGGITIASGTTVTLSGTPAFSAQFAGATVCGTLYLVGVTWSGSATGSEWSATCNGAIFTNGATTNWPTGLSGTTQTSGGQIA